MKQGEPTDLISNREIYALSHWFCWNIQVDCIFKTLLDYG